MPSRWYWQVGRPLKAVKYLLNEPFFLRGWQKLPYALVDTRSGLTEFFRKDVMDALLLCDGRQEIPEEGPVREFLEKLEKNGVIRPAAPGDYSDLTPRRFYAIINGRNGALFGRRGICCASPL